MLDAKAQHIADDGVAITITRTSASYSGQAIISRFKGSYSDYATQNRRLLNLLLASNLVVGEIVTAGSESYLIVVSKKEVVQGQEISIIAHGMLCNTTLTATRGVLTYDTDGNPTGTTTSTVINAVACRADVVTASMRLADPGLLASTVLKVYATNNVSLQVLDKATVNGKYYRVDDINTLEFPGCMVLQLSAWQG